MNSGILDIEKIKEIMGDDKDTIVSFFDLFKEQTAIEIRDLEKFIPEKNWVKVAEIAHKLKSSYGSVGSVAAYDVLSQMEQASKNNPEAETISKFFKKFKEIQNNIVEEMYNFSVS